MGFVAAMHPVFRLTLVVSVLTQATFDFFSGFLVGEYIIQVEHHNAVTGGYSSHSLQVYYWVDVVSFGLCIWMSLLGLYLCCIAGFVTDPYVSYQAINGGPTDRLSVLDEERERRLMYDHVQTERYDVLSKNEQDFIRRKKQKSSRDLKDHLYRENDDNGGDVELGPK
jgi:hypothetical protein